MTKFIYFIKIISSFVVLFFVSNAFASLPVTNIQQILQVEGRIRNNVLNIGIERKDIKSAIGPANVTLSSEFGIGGEIFFQEIGNNIAFMNGSVCLKENEVKPFLVKLLEKGLVFQAFHQHYPSNPQIWFVHFRGKGDPLVLANALKTALNTTAIPFPQAPQMNAVTILDLATLTSILHGHASVAENGVVTIWVYRKSPIVIDGVTVNPQANISTNIQFKPLPDGRVNVVADFSMTAKETDSVIKYMLIKSNWYQGCLYSQEIDETPQLFYDHMIKTGDPYVLAKEIRTALDMTDSQ